MERYTSFESIRNITATIITAAMLGGCLTNDGDTSFSGIDYKDLELSGSVGDGPVTGANIRVFSKDGEILAEFQSDSNAAYNVMLETRSRFFPLTIEATGGTDLVTNQPSDFALTGAVFESGNSRVVNLNPFSTFAVTLARNLSGGLNRSNLDSAERMVVSALNSGLDGLASTGPISTQVDDSNIAEIVKASETLAEMVRRTRDVMRAAGFSTNGDGVVRALASDLTDGVIDGAGGNDTDRRTSAVSTIVYTQVLLESMVNELRVNGSDATDAMSSAIGQVSPATPTRTIDELDVTAEMIERTLVGLAAAYELDENPAIVQLHTAVSGIQAGQDSTLVRALLPAGYRDVLQNALSTIAGEDSQTLDLVNAVARTGGEIDAPNLAPGIQGVPASAVVAGSSYSFTPSAADIEGDVLTFDIVNPPSWATFDTSTGELSGTPTASDVGIDANILISVTDGQFTSSLAPFSITVTASNSAPQISGVAPGSITVGGNYLFTPTASDTDGNTLTFNVSALPSWASFDSSTGRVSGAPQSGDIGTYPNISITVSDGQASASLAPFSITVQAVSLGSVTLNWTPPTENEDGTTLTDLDGYKIYWGATPGNYPNSVTIDNESVSTYVVDNLSPGTYEFVATSFNTAGVESQYSSPATKVVP